MTASIKKMAKGDKGEYYIQCASKDGDYYLEAKEPPGQWYDPTGMFSKWIKDGKIVDADTFKSLLSAYDPETGEELLGKKKSGKEHVSGFDITFSAPKGVSAIWSQLDDAGRVKIEAAQRSAVRIALDFMSKQAGYSRKGKGSTIKEKVHLAGATWEHGNSRENDPQLHTHCTMFNLSRCEDGKFRTIEMSHVMKWQTAIAGMYHVQLAHELQKLGIQVERNEGEFIFRTPDVPEEVEFFFSKRRQQILQALQDMGLTESDISKAWLDKVTTETRNEKGELTRAELLEYWIEQGKVIGFTREQAIACFKVIHVEELSDEQRLEFVHEAAKSLTKTHSVFSESALHSSLCVLMQTHGTAEDVQRAVELAYQEEVLVEGLGQTRDGQRVLSTTEMVGLELRMIDMAKRHSEAHMLPEDAMEAAIAAKVGMSDEQAAAVRWACRNDRLVSIIEGAAGAGKSYTMETVRQVFAGQGYEIHGLALSWSAAGVLSKEAKIENAVAIEGFVRRLMKGEIELHEKSVIIVDEAGLVGSRHMEAIIRAATLANAKVILTGDTYQLSPVEAGGALEALKEEIASCRIAGIRRQGGHVRHDPVAYADYQWQRDAVSEFFNCQADIALDRYDAHGLITMCDTLDETLDAMMAAVKKYRMNPAEAGANLEHADSYLLLANDNATVRELNRRMRDYLRAEGLIDEAEVTIKTTDMRTTHDADFSIGDRIMFRKNDRDIGIFGDPTKEEERSGVYNRTTGRITAISTSKSGAIVFQVLLDGGGYVEIEAGEGGYWDKDKKACPIQHAYASTVHSSQGMTRMKTFNLDSTKHDFRLAGVSMSRHQLSAEVFIDKSAIHAQMMERLGTDEYRPMHEVPREEILDQVKLNWSRASDKLTTYQYIKARGPQVMNAVKEVFKRKDAEVTKDVYADCEESKSNTTKINAILTADINPPPPPQSDHFQRSEETVKRIQAKTAARKVEAEATRTLALAKSVDSHHVAPESVAEADTQAEEERLRQEELERQLEEEEAQRYAPGLGL